MHQFTYTDGVVNKPSIFGIPMETEFEDESPALPGWEYKVKYYIEGKTSKIDYIYDFGDDWQHSIELEKILPYEKGSKYPRCLDGERSGPPEDCGGTHGYANLLEILFDPTDPVYDDIVVWADSMKGGTFNPEEFDPARIKFTKPGWRLRKLLDY